MTSILGLTSTDAVRAVWGISSKDMADAAMTHFNLPLALEVDLLNKAIVYATVVSEGSAELATTTQKTKYLALLNYSLYFCARKIDTAIHLAVAQSVSDGNVSGKRFTNYTNGQIGKEINAKFLSAYTALAESFGLAALTTFSFAGKSTPDVDPVTGT